MKNVYGIYPLNHSISKQFPKAFFRTVVSSTHGENWVQKQPSILRRNSWHNGKGFQ